MGRGRLFVPIADAEPAAEVDVVELDAFAGELVDQAEDLVGGLGHRRRIESWEPMWQSMPLISMWGSVAARR